MTVVAFRNAYNTFYNDLSHSVLYRKEREIKIYPLQFYLVLEVKEGGETGSKEMWVMIRIRQQFLFLEYITNYRMHAHTGDHYCEK